MGVEDGIREIVHTTHAMFDVDGAGLMLADADRHLRSVAASDDGSGTWRSCRSSTTKARASTPSRTRSWSGRGPDG